MTTSRVMALLADGISVSLLCDLASTCDPDSAAINLAERPPGDALLAEAAREPLARVRHGGASTHPFE